MNKLIQPISENAQEPKIIIPIEKLSLTEIDDKKLFEITDSTVIARISETFPEVTKLITKTIEKKVLKNVELFKIDIHSSLLTKSRETKSAYRAMTHVKGIQKNANLTKFDPTKISKASAVSAGITNVMNVGSLVVGQYYMSVIDKKLETINKDIKKINDFQEREFKSRVLSLIYSVGEISKFSSEILEKNDLRNRTLNTLEAIKRDCTKLLQQVNVTIEEEITKNQKPNFKTYKEKIDSFNDLLEYQRVLIMILEKISELNYLLSKGEMSNNHCYSAFNSHLEQSKRTEETLKKWHEEQIKSLKIDINKNRRNKIGIGSFIKSTPKFIDGNTKNIKGIINLVDATPEFIKENLKYKEVDIKLIQKIETQKSKSNLKFNQPEDIYNKNIQIVIKENKYFYLHE